MPIWNTFETVAVRDFWESGCDVIVLWLDSLRKMSALQLFAKRKKAETGPREGHRRAQRAARRFGWCTVDKPDVALFRRTTCNWRNRSFRLDIYGAFYKKCALACQHTISTIAQPQLRQSDPRRRRMGLRPLVPTMVPRCLNVHLPRWPESLGARPCGCVVSFR